jgi:hypothetical protein
MCGVARRHTVVAMVIAEELVLLLTGPAGKPPVGRDSLRTGVAGALLLELAALRRVTVDDRTRLAVLDTRPVGHPLLDRALVAFAAKAGKRPKSVLPGVGKDLVDDIRRALQHEGHLQEQRDTVLGIFPRTSWWLTDPAAVEQVRRELEATLLGHRAPTSRTGGLVALVEAVDATPTLFSGAGGLSRRELKARARAVGEGDWASEAVRKAIADAQAAVVAVIAASAVAASSS